MKEFYTKIFRSQVFLIVFLLISAVAFSQNTYTVTTTADSGPGSLRQAILDVNADIDPGGDYIEFDFGPGVAPFIIALSSPLPAITNTVFINGYTEPSSAEGAIGARTITVQIDGGGFASPILDVQADLCNIAGLSLVNSGGHGINFGNYFAGHRVWGCYIGVAADGVASTGTAIVGSGIFLGYAPDPLPQFGRSIIGTQDLGYDEGTTRANEGNVIGNCGTGIQSFGQQDLRVRGNWVGIAADGATAIPNAGAGILLNTVTFRASVGYNDTDTLSSFLANYVGNSDEGITVRDGAKNNSVAGNFVGTSPSGTPAPIGNAGIIIENAHNNLIGTNANGTADALEGNTVRNSLYGLLIYNSINASIGADTVASISNVVTGNLIDSNGVGIKFDNLSLAPVTKNIIGSDGIGTNASVEANTIQYNTSGGVLIQEGAAAPITLNRISANSFQGNSDDQVSPGLSIVLTDDYVMDPINCASANTGPNEVLNRPVIDSVRVIGTDLHISGWVNAGKTIEFYIASGSTTFDGGTTRPFGELKTYLFSGVEGSAADKVGGISPVTVIGGDGVGGTCTLNKFEFVVPLTSVPAFVLGDNITAIALDFASGPANTSDYAALTLSLLPVTYLSFTGQTVNNAVQLKWQTASESNSSHFDVQRSADGANFVTIGTVSAAGNSQITQNYGFTDAAPLKAAVSYYRLKQVDLDTRFEYSKTILVKSSGSNNRMVISPNPVRSNLVINLVSDVKETVALRLIDNSGRVVKSYNQNLTNGANQIRINDLSTLPAGVYVLQISGKSILINEKIMKQ